MGTPIMETPDRKLREYAESLGMAPHQVATGLARALWEAGPNEITDFADALEFEGKHVMTEMEQNQWEALRGFRSALTEYLSGKNAAFIGGVAVRSYGGRTGATFDYDVMIEPSLLQDTTTFLEGQGAALRSTVEHTYTFHVSPCDVDLDVRVAKTPLDQEGLAKAKGATFQNRRLKVVLPSHLACMKVKSYSERKTDPVKGPLDRNDVRGLVRCGATSPDEIRDVLRRHRPDLLRELEEILA